MYCDKCGGLITEDDAFCGNCGAKVELLKSSENDKENLCGKKINAKESVFNPYNFEISEESIGNGDSFESSGSVSQSDLSGNENIPSDKASVKTLKINKKSLIICIALFVVIIGGLTAFYFIWNNMPVEIQLNDYVSGKIYNDAVREEFYSTQGYDDYDYEYEEYEEYPESAYVNYGIGAGINIYGYDGYADISNYELYNIIDWKALEADVNKELSKKKKINGRHLTFFDFVNSETFSFSADKIENLSNGDVVSITVDDKIINNNGINIHFYGCTYEYTISDLKVVQAFDPFEYVTLMLYGANGYAEAECIVDSELSTAIEGIDGFGVTYYDDSTIAIVKDDYIVAKINFYLDDITDSSDNLKNGDIVTMYCSCTEDLVELYNLYIANYQKDYNINNLGEYVTKSSVISNDDIGKFKSHANSILNERYGDSESYSDIKINSIYIADLKDKTTQSSYHNSLCMIYSYVYTGWYSESEIRYLYVNYEDLIMSPDGTIAFEPGVYFDGCSNGYDSAEEILSSKFSERHNVAKIG